MGPLVESLGHRGGIIPEGHLLCERPQQIQVGVDAAGVPEEGGPGQSGDGDGDGTLDGDGGGVLGGDIADGMDRRLLNEFTVAVADHPSDHVKVVDNKLGCGRREPHHYGHGLRLPARNRGAKAGEHHHQ